MTKPRKTPDQQTLNIKGDLKKKGVTIASIAAHLEITAMAVHKVIDGTSASVRTEEYLVEILGYDPFPERPSHDETVDQPRTA